MGNTNNATESKAPVPAGGMFSDYNRGAKAFWWIVVVLGGLVIIFSVYELALLPEEVQGAIALGLALVSLAAVFPLDFRSVHTIFASRTQQAHALHLDRKRGDRIEYSLGDFYSLLLFFAYGVPAAAIAYAIEASISVGKTSRRRSSWIASPAISALAFYGCGYAFVYIRTLTGQPSSDSIGAMVFAALLFAAVFFIVNAMLVMAIPLLKRQTRPTLTAFVGNFGPIGVWTLISAGFAAFVVFAFRDDLVKVLLYSAAPFALMVICLHAFARQQDAYRVASETQQERFQSLFKDAAVGMAVLTRDGTIQEANAAFGALFGSDPDSLASRSFAEFVDAEDADTWNRVLRRAQGDDFAKFSLDLRCRHGGGHPLWLTVHVSASSEVTGASGLILQAEDSTARVQTTRELDHLAHHDSLTGLANRRRFTQLLGESVATARSSPANGYAVLFLDFDGFKRINDTLGHDAGDRFLVEMTRRMRDSVRPMDVVARLGGDEFAIFLPLQMPEEEGMAKVIAERIVETLAHPYAQQGEVLHGRASIGIVTSKRGYEAEAEVMREADTAMYAAKSGGPGRIVTLG